MKRRTFLKTSGALLAGVPLVRATSAPSAPRAPLDLLILGGTGFIGPHLVRHAVARGHRLTIFTRGRRDADLPAGVTRLIGDRNGQLDALKGKRWDAVFDDSATNPDWVRQSIAVLKDSVGQYLFTSSTGVYYPYLKHGLTEADQPHLEVKDPQDGSEAYGVSKAQCERAVLSAFGDHGLVLRPTYIVGPGDTTNRFPYWPVRLARGGDVLAPGKRDDPVQIIDVRDLAEFMLRLVEARRGGVFNVAGPRERLTTQAFYQTARATVNPSANLVFVDDYAFLEAQKITDVVPWVMQKGNDEGHMSVRNDRAVAAGLGFRPLETTLRDTLTWWGTLPEPRRTQARFALTPEQEAAALVAWRAR